MSRKDIFDRFRELAKLPITPDGDCAFIYWDRATGGCEMGASHDNREDLIKQLGMWRDSEISQETVERYEKALKAKALDDGAGLDEERPRPRIIMPEGRG